MESKELIKYLMEMDFIFEEDDNTIVVHKDKYIPIAEIERINKENGYNMTKNLNPINEIIRFQNEKCLANNKYDALNEHKNIIEELLESVGLDVPKVNREELGIAFDSFVSNARKSGVAKIKYASTYCTPDNEKVDAYCDIVVFAIGAIMKLGYEPNLALLETSKEINSRKGTIINGKFEKDTSDEAKTLMYKADYSKCVSSN